MKRLFNVLAVFACTMLFTACEYYDHAITEHEDRLGQLENSYLKSVEEQIEGINASLYHLEAIDTVLHALRDSLVMEFEKDHPLLPDGDITDGEEGEEGDDTEGDETEGGEEAIRRYAEVALTDLMSLITAIETENAEFDQKVADLKNYVDSGIPATISTPQEWIEITLTTMEHYIAVQTEVAKIKSLIKIYESDITTSYIDAFEDAFTDCEASMKVWVNEALAENYYKAAAVDGELDVLESKADSANNALTEQIVAQQVALDTAKAHLTVAYEEAIRQAIEDYNGKITEEIATAVLAAQDALQSQIDAIIKDIDLIKAEILTIKEDIGYIQDDIATIGEQIEGINASLEYLELVDSELLELIAALEEEAASLQEQLEAADSTLRADIQKKLDNINLLIADLQTKDNELDQKINNLKNYVDSISSSTQDWVETTFSTLEQYGNMQAEIAEIWATIEYYKSEFTTKFEEALVAIEEAFAESEASMKNWVNAKLAEVYYDIATIDGKLTVLETKVDSVDNALAEQIAAQQEALIQAKDELTAAYQAAIKEAIEVNNGKISEEIAKAVKDAQDALQIKIDAITKDIELIKTDILTIKKDIGLIQDDIATIGEQIEGINSSLEDLTKVDSTLQVLIDALEAEAESLQKQFETADSTLSADIQKKLDNISLLIEKLKAKDVELDQKIDDLKAYVNGEISATEDWANATFATLEQYTAMQTDIARLKTLLEACEGSVDTKDLEEAIAASETSMKAWVNKTLADGYYDAAAIDGKLAALQAALDALAANGATDQELAAAIAAQQAALNQAKSELTAAYKQAIEDAMANYNGGNSNGNFDTQIAAAKAELQNQINAINAQLAVIESRLDDLEDRVDALETRIQSIRFVPEYNDGKVDLSSGLATLTFILTPSEAASAIAQAYRTNSNVVTAYITRTKSRTRAVDTPRRMTVNTVSGNANGMLEVSVNASSLPAEYWDGSTSCNIYIHINDGNNDIVSEMIPTYQSTPNTATVEAVDLGLSVKWASCNVGAYSSESYGSYYTWSETNNIDFSDDWRMPTASEMRELRDNCDWRWANVNGISGYRVTGKNGNSIFLPASGFKLNNRTFDEGSYGYYWSSGSGSQANYLEFNSYDYDINGSEPTYGCTVRPVRP